MKYNNIKISVIIPIYNSEKYLRRCIDSVINQTYKNLEIILVDDGSDDKSGQICDEYAMAESRIRVFHKENGGQAAARKEGIKNSVGDYITFVDSDDYIDVETYEMIVSSMVTGVFPDMIAYNLIEEYENHFTLKKNNFEEGFYNRNEIERVILPHSLSYSPFFTFGILPNLVCKMIRKEFVSSHKLDICDKVRFGEDVDMLFQIVPYLGTMQIINYAPYHYIKRDDSMIWKAMKKEEIMCLKNDLMKSFERSKFKDSLFAQLEEYIDFISLLKCPKSILGERLCMGRDRVALYGAGGFGQAIYNQYKNSVIVWADQNDTVYSEKGLPVISIAKLIKRQEEYDVIYIAILDTALCEQIRYDLIKSGIKKEIRYYSRE